MILMNIKAGDTIKRKFTGEELKVASVNGNYATLEDGRTIHVESINYYVIASNANQESEGVKKIE